MTPNLNESDEERVEDLREIAERIEALDWYRVPGVEAEAATKFGQACRKAARETEKKGEPITDGGEVLACPECDSAMIKSNVGAASRMGPDAAGGDYNCNNCYATFDDPVERERKQHGDPRHGLAAELVDADPDDLFTDGGRDLPGQLVVAVSNYASPSRNPVYHLPDPEADELEPLCGRSATGWREVSRETVREPRSLCKLCDPDTDATPDPSGPNLAAELRRIGEERGDDAVRADGGDRR